MGYNSWKSDDWSSYSAQNISHKTSTTQIYTSTNMKDQYNPKIINRRESRDSDAHPNSRAIIIGLDVTGSMSGVLTNVAKKLGLLVEEIYNRKPIKDPHVMFNAIGDGRCDRAPLQVTQFETDITIAKELTNLWFESGGGGNGFESYPLAWYNAANKTDIDCFEKRGEKGFLFTMGDDCFPNVLTKGEINEIFGDVVESDIPVKDILAQVNRKYEVFHLMIQEGGSAYCINPTAWKDLLGERAIDIIDYTKIPEIIISILETMGGKDKDEIVNSWDGSTAIAVKAAIKDLSATTAGNDLVEF